MNVGLTTRGNQTNSFLLAQLAFTHVFNLIYFIDELLLAYLPKVVSQQTKRVSIVFSLFRFQDLQRHSELFVPAADKAVRFLFLLLFGFSDVLAG